MELTSALQSEQHVKKEIARKMGQLQEDLHNAKEQVRDIHITLKRFLHKPLLRKKEHNCILGCN